MQFLRLLKAGIFWVDLIDHFCAGWGILIAAVMELVGVCWIYGGNRFIEDIEMMIGKKHWLFWAWWRLCWFFISPCLLLAILIWSLVTFKAPMHGSIVYPAWGTAIGWCMIAFCLIWIPILAVIKMIRAEGSVWQRFRSICQPAATWGPALEQHYGQRYEHLLDLDPKKSHKGLEIPLISGYNNTAYIS